MTGLRVEELDKDILISGLKDFDLEQILECGQCFRWEKQEKQVYIGIAFGKIIKVNYDDVKNSLLISNSNKADCVEIWIPYFDLDRDYTQIKTKLTESDPFIFKAIRNGHGIRILKQEKWETIVSFIISQNNNIPRIKKGIRMLAETLGEEAGEFEGKKYYNLPTPQKLAKATIADLDICKLGYRSKYLIETAKSIADEGIEHIENLGNKEVSTEMLFEELQRYSGVGPKVANCIALFSYARFDSFPIDVWIKKIMTSLYGFNENDIKGMKEFAQRNFEEYGGIAQQYLFYYIQGKKG